jgi:hypothetical protein
MVEGDFAVLQNLVVIQCCRITYNYHLTYPTNVKVYQNHGNMCADEKELCVLIYKE